MGTAKAQVIEKKKISTTVLEPVGDVLRWGKVRIYFAKINKLIALQLLDAETGANGQNRTVNASNVDRFVESMRAGNWHTTHQGIAFDDARTVIDGQHRLRAIADTDTEWTFLVSEGWEPLNRVATDKGWSRQLRDDLKIMGVSARADFVSIVLNMLRRTVNKTTAKLSYEAALEMMNVYKFGFQWAAKKTFIGRGRGSMASPVVAAFVYSAPGAHELLDRAWDDLIEGAGLKSDDPILKLRDDVTRLRKLRHGKYHQEIFDKTLNAIYLRKIGRSCKLLKASDAATAYFAEFYK